MTASSSSVFCCSTVFPSASPPSCLQLPLALSEFQRPCTVETWLDIFAFLLFRAWRVWLGATIRLSPSDSCATVLSAAFLSPPFYLSVFCSKLACFGLTSTLTSLYPSLQLVKYFSQLCNRLVSFPYFLCSLKNVFHFCLLWLIISKVASYKAATLISLTFCTMDWE